MKIPLSRQRRTGFAAVAGLLLAVGMAGLAITTSAGPAAAGTTCTPGTASNGTTVTETFCWTGGIQHFTVPANVTSLDVTAAGAAGGFGAHLSGAQLVCTQPGPGSPGPGASVEDKGVPVSAYQGQQLTVIVGGAGGNGTQTSAGAGGSPGGGGAAGDQGLSVPVCYSGGGGGYSGLLDPAGTTPLVIAGAGGGGTLFLNGGAGDIGSGGGAGGSEGSCSSDAAGGGGGTATMGGAGGCRGAEGCSGFPPAGPGANGTYLAGGQGGNGFGCNVDGAGGGGGYYGGGGGGAGGASTGLSGAGGGGSSFGVGSGLTNEATATGPASVTISYQLPDADLGITVPGNITADATGPSGAAAAFAVTVTDPDDASPPAAVCTIPSGATVTSGSVFPIGTTKVTCTTSDSDDSNSPVSASFTVTVVGAAAQLASLGQAVQGVGPGTSLADKITAAQSYLASGEVADACGTLTAFIQEVQAQSGTSIPPGQAAQLITDAQRIQAVLAC